jgi:hypothetical protein
VEEKVCTAEAGTCALAIGAVYLCQNREISHLREAMSGAGMAVNIPVAEDRPFRGIRDLNGDAATVAVAFDCHSDYNA